MIDKFKSFLNKDNLEYLQGPVNPYKFHILFYRLSKYFLVLDDEPIPKRNYYFHTFMMLNTAFSILVSLLCFYGGLKTLDITQLTEAGVYIILFSYTLLALFCQRLNTEHYHNFFEALREDFHFVCNDGGKYRARFFETQIITWKLCVCCIFFIFVGVFLVTCASILLITYLLTHGPGDRTERPILFPLWLFDKNVSATPYYEFFFIYTNYTMVIVGFVHCYMTQTQVVWIREIITKADLIIYAIEDVMQDIRPTNDPQERALYDDVLKQRFRKILIQHHSMYDLLQNFAAVYKKLMMTEQKIGGPVMCFTAFASTEKFLTEREIQPVLILIFVATFVICVIPSYNCTQLGEKIRSINDACWNTPFWDAGPVARPYLVLIMQRSLRPLPLQAPGFEDVSLQTFSSKIAAAYSMFNMLRQTNLGSTLNN